MTSGWPKNKKTGGNGALDAAQLWLQFGGEEEKVQAEPAGLSDEGAFGQITWKQ